MVAALMNSPNYKPHAVIVGADRIASNGYDLIFKREQVGKKRSRVEGTSSLRCRDTANKIGTYQLAICAQYHKVAFFVAAPLTTIDLQMENGDGIKIEVQPLLKFSLPNSNLGLPPATSC